MIIILPLQSISDVITNSSSELFASITSDSKETLDSIYQLINRLFGYNQESELTPCVDIYHRPTEEELKNYDYRGWLKYDKLEEYPENWIEIELPYDVDYAHAFYKEGLEAILREKFGDNYKIVYEKD